MNHPLPNPVAVHCEVDVVRRTPSHFPTAQENLVVRAVKRRAHQVLARRVVFRVEPSEFDFLEYLLAQRQPEPPRIATDAPIFEADVPARMGLL